jgi:hypothetical protein
MAFEEGTLYLNDDRDANIVALDASDGTELWCRTTTARAPTAPRRPYARQASASGQEAAPLPAWSGRGACWSQHPMRRSAWVWVWHPHRNGAACGHSLSAVHHPRLAPSLRTVSAIGSDWLAGHGGCLLESAAPGLPGCACSTVCPRSHVRSCMLSDRHRMACGCWLRYEMGRMAAATPHRCGAHT